MQFVDHNQVFMDHYVSFAIHTIWTDHNMAYMECYSVGILDNAYKNSSVG